MGHSAVEPASHQTTIKRALEDTTARQTRAAAPSTSVWVSANAGAGKTHVLTMRTLRLLLAGTAPECILCLTYTKAAASEMSARVFESLAKWVTSSDGDLNQALRELMGRDPSLEEFARARVLFAHAIETPGGLKIQTIHAFCEQLLQRFPLEAGVPPGFCVLDDDMVRALKREAIDDVLARATHDMDGALGRALQTVIAYAADDRFDTILAASIEERSFLDGVVRLEFEGADGDEDDDLSDIDLVMRETLGVGHETDLSDIELKLGSALSGPDTSRLVAALAEGGKTDSKLADALRPAEILDNGVNKAHILQSFFLTKDGGPRTRLMTNAVKKAHPDLDVMATQAQAAFQELKSQQTALRTIEATLSLIRLSSLVLQGYTDLKARRAGLDYDDLIEKTANLLSNSESADWVLYKLDGGLDHILVDESQDTSPAQWRIIESLAAEFFSGDSAREGSRTMFAVGDEKQSIYSFQGAAPEQFSAVGARFEERAKVSKRAWERIPLNLSFRTVPPVLQAVDLVFRDRNRTPGVGSRDDHDTIEHVAVRHGRGGLVEVWPTIKSEPVDSVDVWDVGDQSPRETPAQILAGKIADTISGWIETGDELASESRSIRPRDILILVRKRNPFAGPMVGALKTRGIAVAGADRVDLVEQIAVKDLVALGDFLVLPEDDLSLACVLKSPMFSFDDDDLFAIASNRKGTLWKAVLDSRERGEKFQFAVTTLLAWRKRADFMPPFEFFSGILDADRMRQKIISRLGGEAAEPIDEFLNLMVLFDETAPPSLSGFLNWLRSGKREIKRDMDQGNDEVRVMTVHGAKGLEAPIVFLPDTCTTSSGAKSLSGFVPIETAKLSVGMNELMMWNVKGSSMIEAFKNVRSRREALEREELNRLLYVAMTRARDRLYVAGFEGVRGRQDGCWYDLITDGISEACERVGTDDGGDILRLGALQTFETPDTPKHAASEFDRAQAPPPWAHTLARAEKTLAVPMSPSKLAPYDTDEEGEPVDVPKRAIRELGDTAGVSGNLSATAHLDEPAGVPVREGDDERKFLRGTFTHALLEHLPELSRDTWKKAATDYVDARASALHAHARKSIVDEVLTIMTDERFGILFGPESRAEVALGADIPNPDGVSPPLRLSGCIDRLAIRGDEVFIVDYKTNRSPPRDLEEVADAYLYQLAAYRLALKEIYPSSTLRAALLWTQDSRLMEVPEKTLGKYGSQLWQLVRSAP